MSTIVVNMSFYKQDEIDCSLIKTQIFVWQTSIEFKHLDKPPSLFADVVDVDVGLPSLLHDSSSCVLGMLLEG